MKRIVFSLAVLLLLAALSAHAQVPLITLGAIQGNTIRDGQTTTVTTTREQIIKNKKLTGNDAHCVITGYTFSIVSGSKTWSAHVKGDELTPAIIRKIKEIKGPGVKVYFDGIEILYDGNKASANPVLLTYDE